MEKGLRPDDEVLSAKAEFIAPMSLCFTLFHPFLLADAAILRYEPCLLLGGLGLFVWVLLFWFRLAAWFVSLSLLA